jgi:hypothetical protein
MFSSFTDTLDRFAAPAVLGFLMLSLPMAALTFITNTTAI